MAGGAAEEAHGEQLSTEGLLESLIETFRMGCVVLQDQSDNCEEVLTNTINMAIDQMKLLADRTRTMEADGLFLFFSPFSFHFFLDNASQITPLS